MSDFNGWTFGGEWLYGIGEYFETGVGVSYYQKTVPTVYRDFVDDNGSEISQDLKLKIVPITATVRFLPVGRGAPVEPYVGGGIGIFNWRYTEAGEFVDFSDDTIFRDGTRRTAPPWAGDSGGFALPDRRRDDDRLRVPLAEGARRYQVRPRN